MSHAEAVHTLQPAAGATDQIVQFTTALRYDALPEDTRHYARRHLLDTVGVMIAGAAGKVATQAETVLSATRPAGRVPVPRPASSSTMAIPRARCIPAALSCRRCCPRAMSEMRAARH